MHPTPTSGIAAEIAAGDAQRLVDLARRFHVSTSTAFRWIIRGLPNNRGSRSRLEAIKRGKSWLTSEAALTRFFQSLPAVESDQHGDEIPRTPSKRMRDSEHAQKILNDKYGI